MAELTVPEPTVPEPTVPEPTVPRLNPAPVTVRAPATSANLGPGFDALGLALGLYDTVTAEIVADGELTIEVVGEGAEWVARDERHLVVRAIRMGLAALGVGGHRQP